MEDQSLERGRRSTDDELAGSLASPQLIVSDEGTIACVADEIRAHARSSLLSLSVLIGKTILERLYGGSVERWSTHAAKDTSLRRLADRLGDVRLSAASLYRCVAIHLVLREIGDVENLRHLTPSHVRAVLPVSSERRAQLLRDAESNGWSIRELESRVRAEEPPPTRGRPRLPAFVHTVRKLERLVGARDAFSGMEKIQRLDRDTVEELYRSLLTVRERLEQVQWKLTPRQAQNPSRTAITPPLRRGIRDRSASAQPARTSPPSARRGLSPTGSSDQSSAE